MVASAVLFFLTLMLVGFYTYAKTETSGEADFRYTFENRSYFNGLTFALYAFYFGSLLVLPIFCATEGGAQIAGDTTGGTLTLLLTRPISRARLFFTKLCVAGSFAAASVALLLFLALTVGLFAVGWGELRLYPGVLQMTEARQTLSQGEALRGFLYTWPAASLALAAPLSLSFLVASFSRSTVNAVGLSVALYFVMYVVSEVHFFEELRPLLFTSYMSYWRGFFREEIDWSAILRDGTRLLGFSCLFIAASLHRFRTREEH